MLSRQSVQKFQATSNACKYRYPRINCFSIQIPSERLTDPIAKNLAVESSKTDNIIFLNAYYYPAQPGHFDHLIKSLEHEDVGAASVVARYEDDTFANDGFDIKIQIPVDNWKYINEHMHWGRKQL